MPAERILVVEDEPWRVAVFRARWPGCAVTADVAMAIQWLSDPAVAYDWLFLDHDLGTEPRVGRDVAAWLIAHPEVQARCHVVVHSMNAVSAPKIERELRAAGRPVLRVPFEGLFAHAG